MSISLAGPERTLRMLTVPGLHGSDGIHWQTRWENLYGFSRVGQKDWDNPDYSQWAESLRQTYAPIFCSQREE